MNKNNTFSPTGIQNLSQLIMQLQRLEKSPNAFGEAGPLTPSEIHTIDAIGLDEGVLMSELANRLNITKGAGSSNANYYSFREQKPCKTNAKS